MQEQVKNTNKVCAEIVHSSTVLLNEITIAVANGSMSLPEGVAVALDDLQELIDQYDEANSEAGDRS